MKDWKTKRLVLREGTPNPDGSPAEIRRIFEGRDSLPLKEGWVRVQQEVLPGDPVSRVSVHGKLNVKLFKWTLLVVDIPNLHIDLHRKKSTSGLLRKNKELEERLKRKKSRGGRRLVLPGNDQKNRAGKKK